MRLPALGILPASPTVFQDLARRRFCDRPEKRQRLILSILGRVMAPFGPPPSPPRLISIPPGRRILAPFRHRMARAGETRPPLSRSPRRNGRRGRNPLTPGATLPKIRHYLRLSLNIVKTTCGRPLMNDRALKSRNPGPDAGRGRRRLARLGAWGLAFFVVKGLAWLVIPALLAIRVSD